MKQKTDKKHKSDKIKKTEHRKHTQKTNHIIYIHKAEQGIININRPQLANRKHNKTSGNINTIITHKQNIEAGSITRKQT